MVDLISPFDPVKADELIKSRQKKEYKCMECGSVVTQKDSLCVTCSRMKSRKVKRPSREELKNCIRQNGMTMVALQ